MGHLKQRGAGQVAIVVVAMIAAVVWRLINHRYSVAPNLELCTAATVVAALVLRHRVAAFAPMILILATDLTIGTTSILLFTWTAWLVVGGAALGLPRLWRRWGSFGARLGVAAGFGLGASTWFFAWTNLGVWLLGRGSWYPAGIDGLGECYAAGLPFFRTMLLGNLILVPVAAACVALMERHAAWGPPVPIRVRARND